MFSTTTQILVTQLGIAFPRLSRSLEPSDVELLGKVGDLRLLERGQDLVPPGGRLPGLTLVLAGRLVPSAAPSSPPEHRWVVGAGDVLGIETVLGRRPRHISLRALEWSEVRVIDAENWALLRERHPNIAVGFLRELALDLAAEMSAIDSTLERGGR